MLIEAGWQDLVDEVWVVSVDEAVAVERLMARNRINREDALQRIKSQMSVEEREKHADVVILNSNDLESTCEHIRKVSGEHDSCFSVRVVLRNKPMCCCRKSIE